MLEQGTISIHTENIFPIIKKSLYSDHQIFLRELISNAVDAIQKIKMVSRAGEYGGDIGEPEITIAIDKEKKTLSISDNGIGMTGEEVKKYINQVAFSSAEEFIHKYEGKADQPIIGHFGLGFYSSFMVAKKVEIDTLSYKEGSQAVHWSCDGSPEFTLDESSRNIRGTTITLTLMPDEEDYLETARIKNLVKTYCDFMPVPIKLDGEVLNKQKAPWRESPSTLTQEDYLEFYRYLYPFQEEPLLWVHLNTDYPFIINGILYFPKMRPDVDVTKGQTKLFCNQVFVSDNCDEIIPQFLIPMRGVIDSTDIPLNVSRSALQGDRTVRKIGDYIAKKVGDRLKELYRSDREQYIKAWKDLGTFVKFGVLNDEKFKKQVEDILVFRTTAKLTESPAHEPTVEVQSAESDIWQDVNKSNTNTLPYTTLKEYLERNKERQENKVFYSTDEASQATYIELHKNQGLEVLFMDSFIDTHFINFLEREYQDVKFTRVDSDLDNTLLDDKSGEIVDPTTQKTKSETIKELFEKSLNKPKVNIRTEALKSDDPQGTPPAVVLLPEILRRLREMNAMMQQQNADFPEDHILLVNTAHPLIQNLVSLNQGSIIQGSGESPTGKLVKMICQHVYDLALMSQKGFDAEGMKSFVERSNEVLTKLTSVS
ncbi:molecular chaperone HtpG [Cylindrospermopsis raciborskii S07]|uniref:Molecular chaperone HtpG n=3 Tax=Cylindrospermopsis raciborskii TaxID=77022 RepID=A0A853MCG4_9CYAN|nr:molecular chaperone HtpG [Cylindrospermopsis raciborskii]EFA69680.1 Heat shock protein Hsp90 [Cylindrospermopsis raciborskii CS-505]OBU75174.1 molecular chaperone HtpG [Cylindrospermopsis raciborskii CS-505]OHY32740.1 molecular chaperone HtpG [Cylindrospermopsis raciborskii CS-508]PNJ92460.1 molecular chaperone HtpG [Cylindrospermopsis raciborskii C04]PNJ92790.1 molecular chaperone HtpG [Cylindrospermopsis raciborskii C07]